MKSDEKKTTSYRGMNVGRPPVSGGLTQLSQYSMPVGNSEQRVYRAGACNDRPPASGRRLAVSQYKSAEGTQQSAHPAGTILPSDAFAISVSFYDGQCVLHWQGPQHDPSDWVGMFPSAQAAFADPVNNVISPGDRSGWQWASHGPSFTSSTRVKKDLVMGYVAGPSPYTTIAVTNPIPVVSASNGQIQISVDYVATGSDDDNDSGISVCQLSWSGPLVNDYDWVGMFPSAHAAFADPVNNVISPGDKSGWQWAEYSSPFPSSTLVDDGLVMAYVTGPSSSYKTILVTPPLVGPAYP